MISAFVLKEQRCSSHCRYKLQLLPPGGKTGRNAIIPPYGVTLAFIVSPKFLRCYSAGWSNSPDKRLLFFSFSGACSCMTGNTRRAWMQDWFCAISRSSELIVWLKLSTRAKGYSQMKSVYPKLLTGEKKAPSNETLFLLGRWEKDLMWPQKDGRWGCPPSFAMLISNTKLKTSTVINAYELS